MIIRTPTIDDARALAHIHVETWRSQYRGIIPQDVLDGLDESQSLERWRQSITDGISPGSFIFVAEQEQEVVGFIISGPIREAVEAYTAEIYSLYIHPSAQKKGVGRLLVGSAARELDIRNLHNLIVWVLEANPARGFYERLGGKLIGQKTITEGRAAGLSEVSYGWQDLSALTRL